MENSPAWSAALAQVRQSPPGRTVLLAATEPDLIEQVTSALAPRGYAVIVVGSGVEARAVASTGRVDIALLRLVLPDLQGRQLLRFFRTRATADVAMVVLHQRGDPRVGRNSEVARTVELPCVGSELADLLDSFYRPRAG